MPEFWRLLLDIFYWRRCSGCGQKIENGLLCARCRKALRHVRFLPPVNYSCPDLESICLLFDYNGGIKDTLHDTKFRCKKSLLPYLAEEARLTLGAYDAHTLPGMVACPIPTDRERYLERGYDIPTEIFRKLLQEQGFTWQELLRRVKKTKPQYGLNPWERRRNVDGCFVAATVAGKRDILLLDDIFTTGATMEEAARTLHRQGAGRVFALAFAGGAD